MNIQILTSMIRAVHLAQINFALSLVIVAMQGLCLWAMHRCRIAAQGLYLSQAARIDQLQEQINEIRHGRGF